MKLHQETQFTATSEKIALLLQAYDLELTEYGLMDGGIENCTIVVGTTTGQYVLRVYRQSYKSDTAILRELHFVTYLADNSVPVAPTILNHDGDLITHLKQDGHTWQAILMQHMPGEHPKHYSDELLTNLATVQARIHNLAAAYQDNSTSAKKPTQPREIQFIGMIKDREKLDPRWQAIIIKAENYAVKPDGALPKGLCHLDFDNDNVLSEHNKVMAVLDFDDLAIAPYAMCLAYTLWDVAYDRGIEGMGHYQEAYQKLRPLTKQEVDFIQPNMLYRHYVIGCKFIADNKMNEQELARYLEVEQELLHWQAPEALLH